MKPSFWKEAWKIKKIGFHQQAFNEQLLAYWGRLHVAHGDRVFVPLAGKSSDMLWLMQKYPVVAVELSDIAAREFFSDNQLQFEIEESDQLQHFIGPNIDFFCGDFFLLPKQLISDCTAVYDRAALVALPREIRERYAQRLTETLAPGASMLLITIEYDESLYEGPPFCIPQAEVERLYGLHFDIQELGANTEDFKGMQVRNRAYRLSRRR